MTVVCTTANDFAAALDDWANQTIEPSVIAAQKAIVASAFCNLTEIAPRWSGRYVGSINVSVGTADSTYLPPHPATEAGGGKVRWPEPVPNPYDVAIDEAVSALAELGPYQVVYLSDSVPYVMRIENGWSARAPQGVFALSAGITQAQFSAGYDWSGVLQAPTDTPF